MEQGESLAMSLDKALVCSFMACLLYYRDRHPAPDTKFQKVAIDNLEFFLALASVGAATSQPL